MRSESLPQKEMDRTIKEPIFVDLDQSLIHIDLLHESLLLWLSENPLRIFKALLWLTQGGRAGLKHRLAQEFSIEAESLPYNEELLLWLKQKKQEGHALYLATASHIDFAEKVFQYLGIFDQVLASQDGQNLKGRKKAEAISKIAKNYIYVGDSRADFAIWKEARAAVVVSNKRGFIKKAKDNFNVKELFSRPTLNFKTFIKAIRVHQWAKNALLFVPIATAHLALDITIFTKLLIAFFSFSFCASSVYLLNDSVDIRSDRLHRTKKFRPVALGALPVLHALVLSSLFVVLGFVGSIFVSAEFTLVLIVYMVATTSYSFYLKKVPILDVLVLSFLYTVRLFAGGLAVSVVISEWLLVFSSFLFLSLAMLKRYSELSHLSSEQKIKGRGYQAADLPLVQNMGMGSGLVAVLVFTLYLASPQVKSLYAQPQWLWLCCPVILAWITRVWLLALRNQMHDDPIVFALKDKMSYLAGMLILFSGYLAK